MLQGGGAHPTYSGSPFYLDWEGVSRQILSQDRMNIWAPEGEVLRDSSLLTRREVGAWKDC